jgi:hypothetical protein
MLIAILGGDVIERLSLNQHPDRQLHTGWQALHEVPCREHLIRPPPPVYYGVVVFITDPFRLLCSGDTFQMEDTPFLSYLRKNVP